VSREGNAVTQRYKHKISDVEDYLDHIDVKKLEERIPVTGIFLIADLNFKAL